MFKRFIRFLFIVANIFVLAACNISSDNINAENTNFNAENIGNMGNTMDNLNNGGWVAQDANNIFCIVFKNMEEAVLYKCSFDGKNKEIIAQGLFKDFNVASHLNVVDDWIYYINTDKKIYKMNKNGQDIQKISDIEVTFLLAYKDKLYVKGIRGNTNLFSMNKDGSDIKLLAENVSRIYFYEEYFYYTDSSTKESSRYLFKIGIDDNSKEVVFETYHGLSGFFVYGSNILYNSGNVLYKRSADEENEIEFGEIKNIILDTININKNILYCNDSNISLFLSKIPFHQFDLETGKHSVKNIKFSSKPGSLMKNFIVNNKIYHYENMQLYVMDLDGSNIKSFN